LTVNNRLLGTVQLIKSVSTVNDTLKQVRRYLILGTGLSLILAAIIGAFLAKRALSQIDAITKTAGGITRTKDLGQRLTITETNSEVGRLAETFNAMLDQIQALFNTQKRLVADVSHELRTPLTTVQGNVEYLQRMVATTASKDVLDDKTTADLQEVLGEVESETARMGTMIGDLLLLAQADSGALQLEMQAVEMDTLLLDIFRQTQRLADRRKGKDLLNVRLGSEDQALVWGDRERLRQLLLNLADNAIKYTPAGGTITLGLKNEDGWVQIYVSDTGIGIPEDQQTFIFDRFYRTDKARSRELGGSGLGLSIVAWIVEAHNGHIDVASSPQKGSTFSVWLPALADEDALKQAESIDVGG
jgi:signal transduction histidine kinase